MDWRRMYNESSGLVTWDREGLCVLEQSLITFLKNTGKVIKSAQSQQIKSNVMNGSVLPSQTCNLRCQERENERPVASAGKPAAGAKRGKMSNWCQPRENEQPMPTAGKHEKAILQCVWVLLLIG